MRVSIRQLAQHCGVSVGTVDRVLNNRGGVKDQTRKIVEQAIRELGYQPNYVAKSLSVGKSMSFGVVLLHLNNIFFAQLSDAIVKEADLHGYFSCITLSEKEVEKEYNCIRNLIARQSDGIILFSTNQDREFVDFLSNCGVPVITIMTELSGFPGVRIDDFNAMKDAAMYIVSKRYQRLIYVSTPLSYKNEMNIKVQEARCNGLLEVARKHGIDHLIIDDVNYLDIIDGLDISSEKTAFLCSSDVYALSILSRLRLKGLLPPYDYGLMGCDNIGMLQHVSPLITTISIPIEEIGRIAVRLLVDNINGKEIQTQILPHRIIPGQTII